MKKLIVVVFGMLLISCDNSEQYEEIVGEWNCTSWIDTATGIGKCNNNVYFYFKKDKTYDSKIQGEEASGIYKISEGILYSTPEGKLEISVEINTLNKDSLQFTMSRSGNEEVLTLLRKK
jgi:hypothetical protein